MNTIPSRILLSLSEMPDYWYNLRADLPAHAPLLSPGTREPVSQDQLEELFSQQAATQELDFKTPVFSIPGPVMDYYRTFRPSLSSGPTNWKKPWTPPLTSIANLKETT